MRPEKTTNFSSQGVSQNVLHYIVFQLLVSQLDGTYCLQVPIAQLCATIWCLNLVPVGAFLLEFILLV